MKKIALLCMALLLWACGNGETKNPDKEGKDSKKENAADSGKQEEAYDKPNPYWNELALLLGGLPQPEGSSLKELAATPGAQKHRSYFEQGWPNQEQKFVGPLTQWSASEIAEAHKSSRNVFYPFSGADFMSIHCVYPNADKYVLFGLEPEGDAADIRKMQPEKVAANLENVQKSLYAILSWSFFRTIDMHVDFRRAELNGTLPVLLTFMARTGHEVLDVYRIKLTPEGKVERLKEGEDPDMTIASMKGDPGIVTGNEIKFRDAKGGKVQTLQYYQVDVHNDYINKEKGLLTYLRSLKPSHTYAKAASYLMYKDYFSIMKDLVLDNSELFVQDDSGMPLKMFDRKKWDLTFYGYYTKPIDLFANYYQQDLWDVYNKQKIAKPLEFGTGYQFRKGTSNMMVARKKN